MGVNWAGSSRKWIRTQNGSSSTGTSNVSSTPTSVTVNSSSTYPYLIGTYNFDSSLGGSGTLQQLFSGNTSGQTFTLTSSSFITLKLPPKLSMQVQFLYYWMDGTQASGNRGTYMVQGSNNNGGTWTNLFSSNTTLNSGNNGQINFAPTGLTTTSYNMFRWTFNITTTITLFYNVDLFGQFYYDTST